MSTDVSEALRQAEDALRTLREANYFTEGEWLMLRDLIHKRSPNRSSSPNEKQSTNSKPDSEREAWQMRSEGTNWQQSTPPVFLGAKMSIYENLDDHESINAAEWDEDPVILPGSQSISHNSKNQTKVCRYWASKGGCRYNSTECSFIHASEIELKKSWGFAREKPKFKPSNKEMSKQWITGPLIREFRVTDLQASQNSPKIEKFEYWASYNLLNQNESRTILVPGSPRVWTPPPGSTRLKEDSGDYFRDVNLANNPFYPSEPAIKAILAMRPEFDLSTIDLFGCGSTLGNLLRFCDNIHADFRFDIDRVKNTIVLVRKESSRTGVIRNIFGYGHSFPDAYTTWEDDVASSISHQRIVKYEFAGLKMLVRKECDGYLRDPLDVELPLRQTAQVKSPPKIETTRLTIHDKSVEKATAGLKSLDITKMSPSAEIPLQVEMKGLKVPQAVIFDLKTRAKGTRRPLDMNEVCRRLWLNQTPYIIFAEHNSGLFEPRDIQIKPILADIGKWETDHVVLLRNYHAVLMAIIKASKESVSGKLEVVRRGYGPLEIRERIEGHDNEALPIDVRRKGWNSD